MPDPAEKTTIVINTSPLLALIAGTGDLSLLKQLYHETLSLMKYAVKSALIIKPALALIYFYQQRVSIKLNQMLKYHHYS